MMSERNGYSRLGRLARRELDAMVQQSNLPAQIQTAVLGKVHQPRGRWRFPVLALGIFATAAVAAVALLWPAPPVTFTIAGEGSGQLGATVIAPNSGTLLAFSEGTTVAIKPRGRAKVVRTASHGAEVAVQSGTVQASVAHHSSTQWRFHAGPYEIFVTGTKFDLTWDASVKQLTLLMHEGRVLVSGGSISSPREVRQGESFVAGARESERVSSLPAPVAPALAPVATSPTPVEPSPTRPMVPARRPLALLHPNAARTDAPSTSAASELFARADRVRLSGDERAAVKLFEQVAMQHPRSRLAGLASFAAGRLLLVRLSDPRAALVDLKRARRLGLGKPLDEDCHARIIEALGRLGNRNACAQEQALYLAAFPKGAHANIVAKACR